MQFKSLNVQIKPHQGIFIQWKIEGIIASYKIKVERAPGNEGPWEEIAVLEPNYIMYQDREVNIKGIFGHFFYRLTILDAGLLPLLVSRPFNVENQNNKIIQEVIRQHELLLEGANGHPGFLSRRFACYKRVRFGSKCTYCINEAGEVILDKCPQCKGSRYLEGWSNPMLFYGHWLDSGTTATQSDYLGQTEVNYKQLFLTNYPVIDTGDVLIESDGYTAWRITSADQRRPGGYLVSQTLSLSQIDPQHIEASLEFPE
jgi:hypothetical protein